MRINCKEISQVLGCQPQFTRAQEREITGVAIDSRSVAPGDVFICIPGERTDGHRFVAAAAAAGAAAIIAQRPVDFCGPAIWLVDDTVKAMGKLAAWWRMKASSRVVCITGTAGKTTLKDTLAAILREHGSVAFTRGNHNNQIGLPLSMLAATGKEDYWIIELGISHAGDMEYLADLTRPDLAIILNVGPGHTEGLGQKGVAWHKAQLLRYLQPGGIGLVNGDYPDLVEECKKLARPMRLFGGKGSRYQISAGEASGEFLINIADKSYRYRSNFDGDYAREPVLACVAAADLLGLESSEISAGFMKARLPEGRFRPVQLGNFYVYDDTYNANPLSMRAMLLAAASNASRKKLPLILILGEMGELGDEAPRYHAELGALIAEIRPLHVIWKGKFGDNIKAPISDSRMPGFQEINAPEEFSESFREIVKNLPGAVILIKGSRANHLEDCLEIVKNSLKALGQADVL